MKTQLFSLTLLMVVSLFGTTKFSAAQSCVLYEVEYCIDCTFPIEWHYECNGVPWSSSDIINPNANGLFLLEPDFVTPDPPNPCRNVNCTDVVLTGVTIDGQHHLPQPHPHSSLPHMECPEPVCQESTRIVWDVNGVTIHALPFPGGPGNCNDNCTHQ